MSASLLALIGIWWQMIHLDNKRRKEQRKELKDKKMKIKFAIKRIIDQNLEMEWFENQLILMERAIAYNLSNVRSAAEVTFLHEFKERNIVNSEDFYILSEELMKKLIKLDELIRVYNKNYNQLFDNINKKRKILKKLKYMYEEKENEINIFSLYVINELSDLLYNYSGETKYAISRLKLNLKKYSEDTQKYFLEVKNYEKLITNLKELHIGRSCFKRREFIEKLKKHTELSKIFLEFINDFWYDYLRNALHDEEIEIFFVEDVEELIRCYLLDKGINGSGVELYELLVECNELLVNENI